MLKGLIRGLQHQRIYRIDSERDYGMLTSLVDRADRTINTTFIAEHWDRMGQFYASLEQGHTTASIGIKRLAGFTNKNHFYRANRDLGRLFKTEFILLMPWPAMSTMAAVDALMPVNCMNR